MVFISKKTINGKVRYYLEQSIRLSNGKVKKFSVYLKNYTPHKKYNLDKYKTILKDKTQEGITSFASSFYKQDSIYTDSLLKKLEEMKLCYKEIIKKVTKKQLQDIIDRFTINFTYESNAIEGNSLTLKDVTMILHEKKVVKGKDLREIYETLNTREAMALMFTNKLKVNEADLHKLHKILVKDTGVSFGYKGLPNFLLGRKVDTTPPEKVQKEVEKLLEWYHCHNNVHPLQRAVLFHGKFEQIHPFEDGNGRAGRLLMNIMLLNEGYPPLIVRKSQRVAYFNALEAFDNGYKDKLQRFFVEKYKKTYEKFFKVYMKYLKTINEV